jgi:acyl-CoA thioester hydrolase
MLRRMSAPHVLRLRVRYGETDQMGVVHHANYALYVEESRTTFMRELGCSYAELERRGIGLPVRRLEVRYRAPAFYEDELEVHSVVGKLGGASVRFDSEILRPSDGARIASASVELACIDLRDRARGPVLVPEDLRRVLERERSATPLARVDRQVP